MNAFHFRLAMALGMSVDRLKSEMDAKAALAWRAFFPLALVLLAGCVESDRVGDLQPVVAVGGAYGVVQVKDAPKPAPAPAGPVVPSKCQNCNGKGYVGDGDRPGSVKIPCPVCSPQPKGKAASSDCEDGKCRPVTAR